MIYQHVAGLKPRKHYFPITKGHATTCEVGEILPVYKNELVPGDRVKLEVSSIVRTMPLATPCLQKIYVKLWAFFVPYRVLDEEFKEFYTGGKQGNNAYSLPFYHPDYLKPLTPYQFSKYSLGDEFGFPLGVDFGGVNDPNFRGAPIAYLWNAYNKIWNEYFRDEWRDGERLPNNDTIAHLRYKKDYFTSALPSPQRGNGGAFSWDLASALSQASTVFDGNIPVWNTIDSHKILSDYSSSIVVPAGDKSLDKYLSGYENGITLGSNATGVVGPIGYDYQNNQPFVTIGRDNGLVSNPYISYVSLDGGRIPNAYTQSDIWKMGTGSAQYFGLNDNHLIAPSSAKFGFDISDLRLQVQMQKYEERCQRTGYRFNEYILAHFGQHTSDKTLDRAQFIGYAKSSINISEIPQTSASVDGSFQGNLSGRGLGTIAVNLGTYRAEEPGIIFVLQALVPHTSYASQGVNKMWTKRNRFDFYLPEFAHLSEQAVFKRELYYTGDVAQDEAVFGYQGIYDEYRCSYDEVCGDFRDTLKNWKMAREFANQPELNSAFLDVDGTASYNLNPFFYQGNDYKHYIIDTATTMHSVRPIPLIAEPGLVDHF